MKLAFIFALAPLGARAVCPNSCSSKGTCGSYDQCTCDFGYKASDCSQRMCAQGPAWITTPKGDLNSDLDTLDYTVYQADARFTSQTDIAKLITQESPGGDWESWPGFATAGEAHFYMECSNRGLCNYEDGLCECFEGYEGYACNRMACPNDCSGHGSCQTAKYLTKYPSTVATDWYTPLASADYKFWDGEMALSCSCDAGYAGADCSLRQCPRGDDILTTVDQVYETQFIDIYTKCAGTGSGGDAPSGGCAAESATAVLGGSIRLTYTDHFGEEYTTDLIPGVAAYAGEATHGLATAAEAALKALPNNAISNDIEVTATYCEVHQATALTGIATTGVLTPAVTGNPAYRIVSGAEALTEFGTSVITTDGTSASAVAVGDAAIAAVDTVGETVTVTAVSTATEIATLTFPKCIRLVVNFNGMAGDLPDLKVDTSEVTYAGYTNAQSENSDIASSVSDTIVISSEVDGYTYVAPTSITVTSSSGTVETETSCTASATSAACTKITLTSTSIQSTTTDTFYPETKVEVSCGGRSLGQYMVIEIIKASELVYLQEVIPASTIAASCASASVTVTSVTQFIVTGSDDGTTDNGVKLQNAISGHSTSSSHKIHVSAIYDIDYDGSAGTDIAGGQVDHAAYAVAAYEVSTDSGGTGTRSIVVLDSTMLVTAGKNSASAAVKTVLSSEVPALAAEINSGSETWASLEQNVVMVLNGKGTMEAVECGSRGLCDTEAGECKCFSGYTGVACETQSAISM